MAYTLTFDNNHEYEISVNGKSDITSPYTLTNGDVITVYNAELGYVYVNGEKYTADKTINISNGDIEVVVPNDDIGNTIVVTINFTETSTSKTKPPIYGFCPAGCKWETAHKEDVDVLADTVGVKRLAAVNDVFKMTNLGIAYNLYPVTTTATNWGITLKLHYSISGLDEEIDIDPSTLHTWTDKNGDKYTLPRIAVDGDYLSYQVVRWETYNCSDATNTLFIKFYVKYKTENTDWTEGIVISEVGSGILPEYLSYVGLYATDIYKVELVTLTQLCELENQFNELKPRVDVLEPKVTDLETQVNELEPKVDKYTDRPGTDLVGAYINGTDKSPFQTSVKQTAMPSGRYEVIINADDGETLRFVGDIDNTTGKINVLESEPTTTYGDGTYFIRKFYLFVVFKSIDGSAVTACFYMGRIQQSCVNASVSTRWDVKYGTITKVSVVTR